MGPPERQLFARLRHVASHGVALLVDVAGDRLGETVVSDPVRRARDHRLEAAAQLVLALGSAFEVPQTVFDAVLDRAVVAQFEMQIGAVLDGAPVAAVQGVAGEIEEGARDGALAATRQGQQDAIAERFADVAEKPADSGAKLPLRSKVAR